MKALRIGVLSLVLLGAIGVFVWFERPEWLPEGLRRRGSERVIGAEGYLPESDIARFDNYLRWVQRGSDLDLRIRILKPGELDDLEGLAVGTMESLRVGALGGGTRGALVLIDPAQQKMRIATGYGLEPFFPDGFIGYLIRDHARGLFQIADHTTAIRQLIEVMVWRIREQQLHHEFDPAILTLLPEQGFVTGGGGATASLNGRVREIRGRIPDPDRARFGPQSTPEEAFQAYVAWLRYGVFDPSVTLFTPESQRILNAFPVTSAFFAEVLLREAHRAYDIEVRGDRALLVFTQDPLADPHVFLRTPAGWQADIAGDIATTVEVTGGALTWMIRPQHSPYVRAFNDRVIKVGNYERFKGADNTPLPIQDLAEGGDRSKHEL